MKTNQWQICISLAISLILFTSSFSAQKNLCLSPKKAVDNFLFTWLIEKDKSKAIKFFHQKSFFSDDVIDVCISNLDYEKSKHPNLVRADVLRFLDESNKWTNVKTLTEILILNSENNELNRIANKLQKVAFNQPIRDKYYLVSFKYFFRHFAGSKIPSYFTKTYNLNKAFVSTILFRFQEDGKTSGEDSLLDFLWVRDKNTWEIVYFGAYCS